MLWNCHLIVKTLCCPTPTQHKNMDFLPCLREICLVSEALLHQNFQLLVPQDQNNSLCHYCLWHTPWGVWSDESHVEFTSIETVLSWSLSIAFSAAVTVFTTSVCFSFSSLWKQQEEENILQKSQLCSSFIIQIWVWIPLTGWGSSRTEAGRAYFLNWRRKFT